MTRKERIKSAIIDSIAATIAAALFIVCVYGLVDLAFYKGF